MMNYYFFFFLNYCKLIYFGKQKAIKICSKED